MGMTYFSVLLHALPQSHTSNHQMDPAPKCEGFFIAFLGAYCRVIYFMQFTQSYLVMESLYTSTWKCRSFQLSFSGFCAVEEFIVLKKNLKKQCNQISLKQHFKRTNDHELSFITKTYKTYQCLDLQLATIIIFIMSVSVHYVKVQRSVFPFKSNTESLSHSSGDFFCLHHSLVESVFRKWREKKEVL